MNDDRRPGGGMTDAHLPGTDGGLRRADVAYDHIKRVLIDGRFRQGDGLPVEAIAHELGMSRQPVMEAMKRLAEHGFVEIIPQVGCRVATIDRHEIGDLFRYLAVTEGLLAELAAVRWTAEPLAALRRISLAIGELVTERTQGTETFLRFRALDNAFHAMIGDMADAPLIAQSARRMTERTDFHIATTAIEQLAMRRLELSHREHDEVLHRIERRQGKLAGQALMGHQLGFYTRTFEAAAV